MSDESNNTDTQPVAMEHLRDAVDAVRYRWLRQHFRFANDSMHEVWFDALLEPNDSGVPTDLDQTIDAAMQSASHGEGVSDGQ